MLFTLISDLVKIESLLVLKLTNKQQSGNSSSKFVFSLGYKALNAPRCNMHIVAVLFTEQYKALGEHKELHSLKRQNLTSSHQHTLVFEERLALTASLCLSKCQEDYTANNGIISLLCQKKQYDSVKEVNTSSLRGRRPVYVNSRILGTVQQIAACCALYLDDFFDQNAVSPVPQINCLSSVYRC